MPLSEDDIAPRPDMPDALRDKLFPEIPAAEMVEHPPAPPGKCKIHGDVGYGRFMLIDTGELISDHCVHCLSKVFTELVGVLEVPEEDE